MQRTLRRPSTSPAAPLTDFILDLFRLNGLLLAAGDRLVADLGLTSARWQVLGAIALVGTPLPVAHLARSMGLTRQAVQRVANDLATAGLVEFAPNPHHHRAKLVRLTQAGRRVYQAAHRRQVPWATTLAAGLDAHDLAAALRVVRALSQHLEVAEGARRASPNQPHSERRPGT